MPPLMKLCAAKIASMGRGVNGVASIQRDIFLSLEIGRSVWFSSLSRGHHLITTKILLIFLHADWCWWHGKATKLLFFDYVSIRSARPWVPLRNKYKNLISAKRTWYSALAGSGWLDHLPGPPPTHQEQFFVSRKLKFRNFKVVMKHSIARKWVYEI